MSAATVVTEIRQWVDEPFAGSVSPTHLFLLVGLVLVMVIIWNIILYHIIETMETI